MKKFISLVLALVMALSLTTVAWGADVAKIGNTGYATLQAAVDAARDGETITLLSDIEYNSSNCGFTDGTWYDGVKYTGDKSFTIDLNGKTISDNGDLNDYLLNFINKGTKANEITLKNGTISGGANLWNVISVGSSSETYPTTFNLGGALTINADGSGNSGEDGVAKVRGNSVMNVLSGATVVSTNALYGVQAAAGTATLNIYDGATVTMNMSSGAAVTGVGIVNIYGGTITSAGWGVFTSSSGTPEFTIYGGSITGTAGAVASCADVSSYPTADPSVTISGGDINGAVSKQVYGTPAGTAGGEVIVTGGIFDTNPTAYAASGYEAAEVGSTGGTFVVGQDIDVDANGKITAGTFTDDVSAYVADGNVIVNGEVVKATPAGNTNTYDIKDLTITDPYGAKVPTTGLTSIVKVAAVTNTTTVNGKTTTTFVPAYYQVAAGTSAGTFVECDKSVATYMFTIKGVGSVYVREMNVPAAFDATPVALYTAPKTATCGKVGANEDTYVVVDGKYYATEYTVVPGAESYALVNGKMVVYYGESSAKGHNWLQATKETYDTKTGVITSVKCPDCKGVVAVYAKPGSFDGKEYVKITEGVATNYYYVAGTVATFTGTTTGTTTGGTVTSAETFDAGIAMYVGMSVMAAAGSAVVLKKKD